MKLLLVRHAQTIDNAHKILQGQLPIPLNAKGFKQAKLLAKRLSGEFIDAIYSSDLKRAAQTAKEVHKYHKKVKLVFLKQLRERDVGVFDGMPQSAMHLDIRKKKANLATYTPPQGESRATVQKRMLKAFHAIQKKHENQTVLIVSHGAALNGLICALLGKKITHRTVKRYSLKNASITAFEINGKKARMISFDSIGHLR